MGRLFEIRTINELHHLLQVQRLVTRQASMALDEIFQDVQSPATETDETYLAQITMERECQLLEKYARQPSLTEMERDPQLVNSFHPGATFGVASVVGEVILSHIRTMAPMFANAHRLLLMVMLSEFDKPTSDDIDLVQTFSRSIRVQLDEKQTGDLSPSERQRLLHGMLSKLAEAMVLVSNQYKLIENVNNEGWVLTPIGYRVMVHLFDAQRFIDSVADAHRRFQQEAK
jgi:hypothetical protein